MKGFLNSIEVINVPKSKKISEIMDTPIIYKDYEKKENRIFRISNCPQSLKS